MRRHLEHRFTACIGGSSWKAREVDVWFLCLYVHVCNNERSMAWSLLNSGYFFKTRSAYWDSLTEVLTLVALLDSLMIEEFGATANYMYLSFRSRLYHVDGEMMSTCDLHRP